MFWFPVKFKTLQGRALNHIFSNSIDTTCYLFDAGKQIIQTSWTLNYATLLIYHHSTVTTARVTTPRNIFLEGDSQN